MPKKTAVDQPNVVDEKLVKQLSKNNRKIRNLSAAVVTLILVLLAGGVFGGLQYQKLNNLNRQLSNENKHLSNPEESAKAESDKLKAEVSKLVNVPTGEEPTIATVVDVNKLKDQSFFANAENGDKVFMYAKAKKAILYRPSTNKIIELAPINSQQNTPDKQAGVEGSATASPGTTQQPAPAQ